MRDGSCNGRSVQTMGDELGEKIHQLCFCLRAPASAPALCWSLGGWGMGGCRAVCVTVRKGKVLKWMGGSVGERELCHSNSGIAPSCPSNPAVTMTPWGDLGGEGSCGRGLGSLQGFSCLSPWSGVLHKDSRCHLTGLICQIQFHIK